MAEKVISFRVGSLFYGEEEEAQTVNNNQNIIPGGGEVDKVTSANLESKPQQASRLMLSERG